MARSLLLALLCAGVHGITRAQEIGQIALSSRSTPTLQVDGYLFKDLNHNGRLDDYEDWRKPAQVRASSLLAQMTLEEKAGQMFHSLVPTTTGAVQGSWDFEKLAVLVQAGHIGGFDSKLSGDIVAQAAAANKAQSLAEATRLGIPLIISSDPRHQLNAVVGAGVDASGFSQWPDALGFAAIADPVLVRRFADIARQEYLATGLRMTLSPMADLATEPRWPRINGTFGEDPTLARDLVEAYVEGFQNGKKGVGPRSVAAVVKHWVGYGASANGYDAHNPYGTQIAFPAGQFEQHIRPFDGAFSAHVSGVMTTYAMPAPGTIVAGRPAEPVGAAFSKQMITDLLRNRYGFEGVVMTDFLVTRDCLADCQNGTQQIDRIGMPWGVESLSEAQRFAKAIEAGVDDFGGVVDSHTIVALVRAGTLSEARIDQSVLRILRLKFALGLFEDPYVDAQKAASLVGNPSFRAAGLDAQRRAHVLLKTASHFLPLDRKKWHRVFLYGVSASVARAYGFEPVERPEQADIAIVRLAAPFQSRPAYFFGRRQHEGSLAFSEDNVDYRALRSIPSKVPVVTSVYLDRPAILGNVRDRSEVLLANFGASDAALFDILTGKAHPAGKLPFELPASMVAVEAQRPDAPHDSVAPLYPIGYGLSF
jgi:beta-glucosidase